MIHRAYQRFRRKMCYLCGDTQGVGFWSGRIATDDLLPILRDRFDPQIPPEIHIEIGTDCNYRCEFCPQSTYQRPTQYMTREAFHHIVEELTKIQFHGRVVLNVSNEPFLHPLILEFCTTLSEEVPGAKTHMFSNGSLITEEHIKLLSSLRHPPSIDLNDYTKEHKIAARIAGIVSFMSTAKNMRISIRLRAADEVLTNRAGNQRGGGAVVEEFREIVCTWPFVGMFIRPDLKVFLCCADYRHEVILGDLAEEGIMDIWAGGEYLKLRQSMLQTQREDIGLCRRCDAETFNLPNHCEDVLVLTRREIEELGVS